MGGNSSSHVVHPPHHHLKTGPSYGSSNASFRIRALRCLASQSLLFILVLLYAFIITIVAIRRSRVKYTFSSSSSHPSLTLDHRFIPVTNRSSHYLLSTYQPTYIPYLQPTGPYVWAVHGSSLSFAHPPPYQVKGSCFCGSDDYCLCGPSLAIDTIL